MRARRLTQNHAENAAKYSPNPQGCRRRSHFGLSKQHAEQSAEDSPNAECCRSGSEFGLFKTRTMRGEQRSKSKTCLDHLDLPKKGNKCKTIMIMYSSSQNGESAQLKLSHIRPKSADPHAQHDQQANSIKKRTRHVGGGSHSSGSW